MITPDNLYFPQVRLLVGVLPTVARERCFALKGGTAINLFVRDMPRLSVDIDLVFVPIGDRATALREIDAALGRITDTLTARPYGYAVRPGKRQEGNVCGLLVSDRAAEIKIEVSPVLRGSVYPEALKRIVDRAEVAFGFAEVLRAFLVYLISHDGSIARVLNPTHKPLEDLFERQFVGMTAEPVTLKELEQARTNLIAALHDQIGEQEKSFLMSFKRGNPQWELLGVEHAAKLPAVRWKLQNLGRMSPEKHREALGNLERILENI